MLLKRYLHSITTEYQENRVKVIQICGFILLILPAIVQAEVNSIDEAQKQIDSISNLIDKNRKDATLYVKRGELYFLTHDFDSAVEDFTMAIKLDTSMDDAWFGRGMARGRMGYIDDGITDLSVYIKRNPNNSMAFTKRGVRYLWKGDKINAQRDLEKAIRINPNNAEAHDDLGIILAQNGDHKQAIEHFSKTVSIDPTYQKGHHNLAIALYITENDIAALVSVDKSLALKPDSRDSMLLKSKILAALGRHVEAKQLEDEGMFLPEANWSERALIN